MKTLKKTLSLILAVCILASMAAIASVSVRGAFVKISLFFLLIRLCTSLAEA